MKKNRNVMLTLRELMVVELVIQNVNGIIEIVLVIRRQKKMTELETLKDLPHILEGGLFVSEAHLKQLAIKWVKEDITEMSTRDSGAFYIINKWMKRLNITEDDLQ